MQEYLEKVFRGGEGLNNEEAREVLQNWRKLNKLSIETDKFLDEWVGLCNLAIHYAFDGVKRSEILQQFDASRRRIGELLD
jgi:hypothetical protein